MTTAEYNKTVDLFADGLYRFLLKNVKDKDAAQDLVQDTYTKLWSKVEDVSFDKAKSYIFTTGYHTMIDQMRKEKRHREFQSSSQSTSISHDRHQYNDINEALHHALDKLPAIQKSVILLRDYEGYSYEEIEKITGLNESQVKVYIYRGRIALKNYIVKIENIL